MSVTMWVEMLHAQTCCRRCAMFVASQSYYHACTALCGGYCEGLGQTCAQDAAWFDEFATPDGLFTDTDDAKEIMEEVATSEHKETSEQSNDQGMAPRHADLDDDPCVAQFRKTLKSGKHLVWDLELDG